MKPLDLQLRTKKFAIQIIKLAKSLEKDFIARTIANQILRSGTSVAANYRAACRSRSPKDFVAKLGIIIEEADETQFWLELLVDTGLVTAIFVAGLQKEYSEILAIMIASKKSALANQKIV